MSKEDFIENGQPTETITHTYRSLKVLGGLSIALVGGMTLKLYQIEGKHQAHYRYGDPGELSVGLIEGLGTEGILEYYLLTLAGDAREARRATIQSPHLGDDVFRNAIEPYLQRLGYTSRDDDDSYLLLQHHRRVVFHDYIHRMVDVLRSRLDAPLFRVDMSKMVISNDGTAILIPEHAENREERAIKWDKVQPGDQPWSDDLMFPYKNIAGVEFEVVPEHYSWMTWTDAKDYNRHNYVIENAGHGYRTSQHFTNGKFGLRNDGAMHVLLYNPTNRTFRPKTALHDQAWHSFHRTDDLCWVVVSLTDDLDRWQHANLWEGVEGAKELVKTLIENRVYPINYVLRLFRVLRGKPFKNPLVVWGADFHEIGTEDFVDFITESGKEVARYGYNRDETRAAGEKAAVPAHAAYEGMKLPSVPEKPARAVGEDALPSAGTEEPIRRDKVSLWKRLFG